MDIAKLIEATEAMVPLAVKCQQAVELLRIPDIPEERKQCVSNLIKRYHAVTRRVNAHARDTRQSCADELAKIKPSNDDREAELQLRIYRMWLGGKDRNNLKQVIRGFIKRTGKLSEKVDELGAAIQAERQWWKEHKSAAQRATIMASLAAASVLLLAISGAVFAGCSVLGIGVACALLTSGQMATLLATISALATLGGSAIGKAVGFGRMAQELSDVSDSLAAMRKHLQEMNTELTKLLHQLQDASSVIGATEFVPVTRTDFERTVTQFEQLKVACTAVMLVAANPDAFVA